MSFNAASLKLMADKGLSAHDIAEIAAAAEGPRSSAAERQARYRERKKTGDVTRDVTSDGNGVSNDRDILTFPEVKKSEPKGSSKKVTFVLPDDIPAEPWAGFEEMRKGIRKPMSNHARALAVAELRRLRDEEGWPPGVVLNHCTMNSYQGIYPPKRGSPNDRPTTDPTTEAVRRILGNC